MKKKNHKINSEKESMAQTAVATKKQPTRAKHQPPVGTTVTEGKLNTAEQEIGLNEAKTIREDLLPMD